MHHGVDDEASSARVDVLIADPNEGLLAEYRELLWEDFELVTVSDGVECISRLREHAPDVLVLEPQLPWGGGDGVLSIMSEHPELAIVLVMILSSCRDVPLLKRVAPFAIRDYCVKPLTARQLATRISNVIKNDGPRRAAAKAPTPSEPRPGSPDAEIGIRSMNPCPGRIGFEHNLWR